jgi:hypothetical protein
VADCEPLEQVTSTHPFESPKKSYESLDWFPPYVSGMNPPLPLDELKLHVTFDVKLPVWTWMKPHALLVHAVGDLELQVAPLHDAPLLTSTDAGGGPVVLPSDPLTEARPESETVTEIVSFVL